MRETQSVQQTLPKLQFVVKYARRSRHESTIRYRNMNLQGSKTHIMPLNLVQQNSLYFIEDPELKKAFDEARQMAASNDGKFKNSPREVLSNLPSVHKENMTR